MNDVARARSEVAGSSRWSAQMIRPLADKGVGTPSSFLRKDFSLDAVRGDEVLRISALGLYCCFINGRRVGDDLLTPGWTVYDKRLSYQSYVVGDLLLQGDNRIEIWLADGWMRSQMMWRDLAIYNTWGDKIGAIAELRGEGGGSVLLRTDPSWQSGELPVRRSGIYFGEIYDARVTPEASAGSETLPFDTSILIPHETRPVRERAALPVVKSWEDEEGRIIYDFGQNSAGYVSFKVRGEAGARVLVEHSEILDGEGRFNNANFRTAAARLEYTLKGGAEESYRPLFTFQGFRYARVTLDGRAEIIEIESIPITSVGEPAGSFTSGHPLVNRLVENTIWSQRANFIEVPTDCPQRDERLGWTGDAQVFAGAACYLHECQSFFRKYLRDVMADQRPDGAVPHVSPDPTRLNPENFPNFAGSTGWGDAIAIIPWQLWLHYRDRAMLEEALPAMVRWVDYVWSISDGPIVMPPRERHMRGFTFGDWLQPSGPTEKPWPTIGDDAAATIYLYIASELTGRIAGMLGEAETARRMGSMAEEVKKAFASEFVTATGRLVYDDQTSYALAFLHDLIPEEHREAAKRYFKATIARAEGRVGTGFIGTPALLPALVKIGERELAARVFLQEEVPGWLYQVKMGATTIWERWDAIKPDGTIFEPKMNSYNHYAYGAVCQWLFEGVAGFRPDPEQPGFRRIIFEPVIIPALSPVAAHHDTLAGRVTASWEVKGDRVTYSVTVPEGAAGTLRLPPDYADILVDGTPLRHGGTGSAGHELAPGAHTITFRLARGEE
ncbi:family 78 glycoside hydrolase catalytic domain [Chelativorans sp.]|uniref:alpha-L-rhamnosidase n=1 Tax=Chelativorans sp. TaxID=2203393 RepID=UPI00281130F2|nr:family 78 glycoside hydrolase catalytic domain [Chelativorans sp.]